MENENHSAESGNDESRNDQSRNDESRNDETRQRPSSGSDSDRDGGARRRDSHFHRDHHRRHKGRVLHTRVSEDLSEEIRRLARDLRVPASNLVRNVLEEVFSVVESVSDDVGQLFEDVVDEAEAARERLRRCAMHHRRRPRGRFRRRWGSEQSDEELERELRRDEESEAATPESRPRFDDMIGWQPLVLNRQQRCARCDRELPRGERAYLGLHEQGISRVTLCQGCTEAL